MKKRDDQMNWDSEQESLQLPGCVNEIHVAYPLVEVAYSAEINSPFF